MPNIWWLIIILLHIKRSFQQNKCDCGVPKMKRAELILHGSDTNPGEWPWHVAIYHASPPVSEYVCGGTLISEQFILTAAHCVINRGNGYQLPASRIFVRMGVHNLKTLNTQMLQQHDIDKIHKYANFTNKSLEDDIAVLQLNTLAQFNEFVQPACVNQVKDIMGKNVTVIGWGLTENYEISAILRKVEMPTIDDIKCLKSNRGLFGQTLDEGMFCAGYTNGTSVCNGDSGSGLFIERDNVWYLGGIVSYSASRSSYNNLCRTDGYGVFTKVQKYLPWIIKITKLHFLLGEKIPPSDDDRNEDPGDCGATNTNATVAHLPRNCGSYLMNRITGGENANVFELPWMAVLQYDNVKFCTGSLISKRYVLTSCHCVHRRMPRRVLLGEHTRDQVEDCNVNGYEKDCAPPVRDYEIECIIKHPEYNEKTKVNDIALIRLKKDVILEDHILPICLPVTSALQNTELPRYIVAGWGITDYTDFRKFSKTLQKATIAGINSADCNRLYNLTKFSLRESHICAGDNTSDTCLGDAGSPLGYIAKHKGVRFVQFGITSTGYGCGYLPSIYTRVGSFMDWIKANLRE